jgi:hypothetical protein
MNQKIKLLAASIATLVAPHVSAQVFATFENFNEGEGIMFDLPRRSPTTSGNIATTPNIGQVTSTFPAGNSSSRTFQAEFSFLNTAPSPWLRLTTAGASGIPNPTIDLNQNLAFDIHPDRPIRLALGVRETGSAAAIGADGGTTGPIEWVGASGVSGGAPIPIRLIPGGKWTHVVFDIDGEQAVGFTGDGTIDKGVTHKGVLEHLAIVPADGSGQYEVFVDNFEVTPVPEPAGYAMIFGALALGGAILRRRFAH